MNCASIEQLIALARNQLPAVEAERLRAHLRAGCEACGKRLEEWRRILAARASREITPPPEWLIHQAMTLFRWRASTLHESAHKSIPAFLLVNSGTGLILECRGGRSASRHMLYRVGSYDIDLLVDYVRQAHSVNLIGQSMPVGVDLGAVAHGRVELLKDGRRAFVTKTNDVGRFTFDGVPEDVYDLKLTLRDEEIDILELNLLAQEH